MVGPMGVGLRSRVKGRVRRRGEEVLPMVLAHPRFGIDGYCQERCDWMQTLLGSQYELVFFAWNIYYYAEILSCVQPYKNMVEANWTWKSLELIPRLYTCPPLRLSQQRSPR